MFKIFNTILFCVLAGGWGISFASPSLSPVENENVGKIVFVLGVASIVDAQGNKEPATRGAAINVGSQVITGDRSRVGIRMVDGAREEVFANSEFAVEAYHYNPLNPQASEVKFSLKTGGLLSETGKAGHAAKDKYRLNTPLAAIGIRGTEYIVQVGQDFTQVQVLSGGVVMSGFDGQCRAEGIGPCQGGNATVLMAEQRDKVMVLKKGQQRPELVPAVSNTSSNAAAPASNTKAAASGEKEKAGSEAKSEESEGQKTQASTDGEKSGEAGNTTTSNTGSGTTTGVAGTASNSTTASGTTATSSGTSTSNSASASGATTSNAASTSASSTSTSGTTASSSSATATSNSASTPGTASTTAAATNISAGNTTTVAGSSVNTQMELAALEQRPDLKWGRWDPGLEKEALASGYEVVAQTGDYTIMRQKDLQPVIPEEGVYHFTPSSYDVVVTDLSKSRFDKSAFKAAEIKDADLKIDFAKKSFGTSFAVVSPDISTTVKATGALDDKGLLKDDGSNPSTFISGAMGADQNAVSTTFLQHIDKRYDAAGGINWVTPVTTVQ